MITIEKLIIYEHYEGDIDFLYRIGTNEQKTNIRENDWSIIDNLIQDLEFIEKGIASMEFKFKTIKTLKKVCDNAKTQKRLKSLIGKYP